MRYKHLNDLLYQYGVKKKEAAHFLGITQRALNNKINGVTRFSWDEACAIHEKYFPELSKDEVFREVG